MTTHELKTWPDLFEDMITGVKMFEVRFNDRGFRVGDLLHLQEWDDRDEKYTGRSVDRTVTYILYGHAGLREMYVVLGTETLAGEKCAEPPNSAT